MCKWSRLIAFSQNTIFVCLHIYVLHKYSSDWLTVVVCYVYVDVYLGTNMDFFVCIYA